MLKGHVQIDLHNHKSGSKERIEQDNLVTNALDMLTNYVIGRGQVATNYIMPIYTRALGGLMIFEDPLVESVDNVAFPYDNTLIGYAGQSVDTTELERGSLNNIESVPVENGFMTVWDFSTSQANGQISSLSRTHYSIDVTHPLFSAIGVTAQNIGGGGNGSYTLELDKENRRFVQLRKVNNQYNAMEIELPLQNYLVTNSTAYSGSPVTIDDTHYISYQNTIYSTGGYAYHLNSITRTSDNQSSTGYYVNFEFTKIDISNPANHTNITFIGECPESVDVGRFGTLQLAATSNVVVSDGYVFTPFIGEANGTYNISYYIFDVNGDAASRKKTINDMHVIDSGLDDISIPSTASNSITAAIPATNGTCILVFPDILDTRNKMVCFLLKNDGNYKKYSRRMGSLSSSRWRPTYYKDGFTVGYGAGAADLFMLSNYLGTICNLQTPFEKTSTTTMKVKYTLTNV